MVSFFSKIGKTQKLQSTFMIGLTKQRSRDRKNNNFYTTLKTNQVNVKSSKREDNNIAKF